jgi:hypothetical protein
MATVIAAAALAATSGLDASPAYAGNGHGDSRQQMRQQGEPDVRTVSFTGGSVLSMLVCKSEPSQIRLAVPAESRVMFVNRLGQNATLRVNGQAQVQVGPNQAAPVVFHFGPVSVSMTFPCGAGVVQQFSSATVSVTHVVPPVGSARPTSPGSAPRPTATAVAAATSTPRPTALSSRAGRAALSAARPSAGASATTDSPVVARSAAAVGTSPTGRPTDSGKEGNPVAVEPLVHAADLPRDSTARLLALIAAVCAVGVTIGVIRVIISKRTTQTRYA